MHCVHVIIIYNICEHNPSFAKQFPVKNHIIGTAVANLE
jgi:hypothetical protein